MAIAKRLSKLFPPAFTLAQLTEYVQREAWKPRLFNSIRSLPIELDYTRNICTGKLDAYRPLTSTLDLSEEKVDVTDRAITVKSSTIDNHQQTTVHRDSFPTIKPVSSTLQLEIQTTEDQIDLQTRNGTQSQWSSLLDSDDGEVRDASPQNSEDEGSDILMEDYKDYVATQGWDLKRQEYFIIFSFQIFRFKSGALY